MSFLKIETQLQHITAYKSHCLILLANLLSTPAEVHGDKKWNFDLGKVEIAVTKTQENDNNKNKGKQQQRQL